MRKQLIPFLVAGLSAATVLTSVSPALAAPTFAFGPTGSNILNIGDFTVATYESGLKISNLGSATRSGDNFTFPVIGGAVDAASIDLESVSQGGMEITNGPDVVTMQSPIVNTVAAQPIMTFLVTINGTLKGRYEVFDLKVPSYAKPQALSKGESFKAANIVVTLSHDGANLLNTALHTTFPTGQSVGSLKVKGVLVEKLPG